MINLSKLKKAFFFLVLPSSRLDTVFCVYLLVLDNYQKFLCLKLSGSSQRNEHVPYLDSG